MKNKKHVKKIRVCKKLGSKKGISLIEIMVAMTIFVAMSAGIYTMMATSQSSWLATDAQIQLTDSLRKLNQRISKELRESGEDFNNVMQVQIHDGAGPSSTDVIEFAVPIVCETTGRVMDANSEVANWGAPLTWGCTSSTCMDADDDCTSRDYAAVEYRLDASNQLLRNVLDDSGAVVRTDIFAENITDLQASLSGDKNVVTLISAAQTVAADSRIINGSSSINIYLRNK